ncbi:hypothetical protein [Oceanithermus sp.]
MDGWIAYVFAFLLGTAAVTLLFYATFNPRALAAGGENVELGLIGRTLLMIVVTATAVAAMLLLGREYVFR